MNFIINLSSVIHKSKVYNIILIIVNWYLKMIYYIAYIKEIDASELKERLIKKIFSKFRFLRFIISDRRLMFILKYWETLYYYLYIKRYLFTAFHL